MTKDQNDALDNIEEIAKLASKERYTQIIQHGSQRKKADRDEPEDEQK